MLQVWDKMGGALVARGLVRLRMTGCEFVDNGGHDCLAGGAVALGTQYRHRMPAHATSV